MTSMGHARFIFGFVPALAATSLVAGCAVAPPTSPRVMALPGPGKDFGSFQQDDAMCRQIAYDQNGGPTGAQIATNNAVGTTIAGTAIGAGLGAALGSLSGNMGAGAAVGGTMGALVGGSAGANSAQYSAGDLQQRFDISYTQCMYARGDSVQSPPGGYRAAGPGPYPYYGPAYVGGPTVVIGGGWGWGWGRGHWHR